MIKNERQYRITKTQAGRFSEALRSLESQEAGDPELHDSLRRVQIDALRSQLADLEMEIQEFETLKAGRFAFEQLRNIAELPRLLISARIARGFSQREFADRLGLKEQQIQRYEASDYASASLSRIREVANGLSAEPEGDKRPDERNNNLLEFS